MRRGLLTAAVILLSGAAFADDAPPSGALARMPVKEITVFKDGHAFVLHEGKLPADANGDVRMDYLPTPVLGTFWPYSSQKEAKLTAVTASQSRVQVGRTALSVRELIEANPNAEVDIQEISGEKYRGRLLGMPARSGEELEATSPPNSGPRLPEKGNIVLLQTAEGVRALPIERILHVQFRGEYRRTLAQEEFRNLLTLHLDWQGAKPAHNAEVGMIYLQKGIRWIPSYKITLDGKGNAAIQLQATLLNELTDLQRVTANLVIGVPSFLFKETPDPISLQQSFAQLSPYFQENQRTGFALSNAMMTQTARMGDFRGVGGGLGGGAAPPLPADVGPEVAGSEGSEDLFIFTVKNVTLKKGQRMVLPIAAYALKYRDIYTLELPFSPPPQLQGNVNSEQQAELMRLLNAPKVQHKIRLTNQSAYPFTTAPALILLNERVLGQGILKYPPVNAEVDLTITTAVDVKVKRTDKETQRTPNAVKFRDTTLGKIDLAGKISLTNYRKEAVQLEVTRYVLGHAGKADQNGTAEMMNFLEDDSFLGDGGQPSWWRWYNWPPWWNSLNGVGRFTWKLKLDAGKSVDLNYTWHYFWE